MRATVATLFCVALAGCSTATPTATQLSEQAVTAACERLPDTAARLKRAGRSLLSKGVALRNRESIERWLCCVEKFKFDWTPGNVLSAEIFDPTAETWTLAADMVNPRHYHSVGVLLPDGRVLATGTTSRYGNDQSMEIYSPPYLFRGPRPRISGYPAAATYGASIEVDSPDACRVVDACLVRPAAPTHHTDTEQRLVPLHIMARGDCTVTLMIPNNAALLPPGYYMLFILDDCDIPSIARFVHIS